MEKLIVQNQL